MKIILLLLPVLCCFPTQENTYLISGKYDEELHLAFNPNTKTVTGYFQSSTGNDERTGKPKFTCSFYLEGKLEKNKINVTTYYPLTKEEDLISGTLTLTNNSNLSIRLSEEHGGCWNVQPFSSDSVNFKLSEKFNWIEIRYVLNNKSYFYSQKNELTIRKAYLISGDIVHIEKIEDNWAYCHYYGKTTSSGWLKLESLNKI